MQKEEIKTDCVKSSVNGAPPPQYLISGSVICVNCPTVMNLLDMKGYFLIRKEVKNLH